MGDWRTKNGNGREIFKRAMQEMESVTKGKGGYIRIKEKKREKERGKPKEEKSRKTKQEKSGNRQQIQ